jgi:hypothetical protein
VRRYPATFLTSLVSRKSAFPRQNFDVDHIETFEHGHLNGTAGGLTEVSHLRASNLTQFTRPGGPLTELKKTKS